MKLFNMTQVNAAAGVLRAIRHPMRRQIMAAINANPEMNVNELGALLELDHCTLSQQLGILRHAGVVSSTTKGKQRMYNVNKAHVAALQQFLEEVVANMPVNVPRNIGYTMTMAG